MSRLWMYVISMYIHAGIQLEPGLIRVGRSFTTKDIVLAKLPTQESSPSPSQLLSNNITDQLEGQSPHVYHKCGHDHCTARPRIFTSKSNLSFRHKAICAIVSEDTPRVMSSLTDSCVRPCRYLDRIKSRMT
ncbi:hypothetical protein PILCRDRAFT_266981 [Piloderma croceum F 1598]|uniref:Uncharacterized protein n=1 Tax=Piloderma croceum (strain F 1598) TaxID=765440 RepID=A0A0C3CE08_PILCF|nr:hypothetical protein PILCRDRAFT_266981 [Piloderma croceum F 1598]